MDFCFISNENIEMHFSTVLNRWKMLQIENNRNTSGEFP